MRYRDLTLLKNKSMNMRILYFNIFHRDTSKPKYRNSMFLNKDKNVHRYAIREEKSNFWRERESDFTQCIVSLYFPESERKRERERKREKEKEREREKREYIIVTKERLVVLTFGSMPPIKNLYY